MSNNVNQDLDVTVVGAGPVGLVLAAELALAGAAVQVIERLAEPDDSMKAQSINVATAEALDRRGMLPAAEEAASRVTGHFAGIVLDADLVDWSDPDFAAHTAADGARMIPQPQLEALLAERVALLGVPVHRGVELTALQANDDGVLVGTTAGSVRTGWLVGCDGGHSAVRRLAGIDFPGTDPELTGYQAVAQIADPEKLADGWAWSVLGAYRCGPQPGRVATVEFGDTTTDRSVPVSLEDVQSSLRRVSGTDVTLTALRSAPTRWTDNARQAATYRSGRVLLAGDAAHVHPPFGGQGLNLGVGDAMNLGWKLGAVLAGWAPAGLLDTYDAERRPLGAWVLDWTRAQTGMMRGDAKSAALREIVVDLLGTTAGTTYAVKKISGVTQWIELPGAHPLVGRFVPDLWLGDGSRLVDHGHRGEFLLLDRTPDGALCRVAASWAGRVKAIASPVRHDQASPIGVLVRPDGVVAWASDTTDTSDVAGLEVALRQWGCCPSHLRAAAPRAISH